MNHPYLFFSENDILKFRNKIDSDKILKSRYTETVSDADKCLSEEFVAEEDIISGETGFGSVTGQASRLCNILGTKYAVENDKAAAEYLKKFLQHIISFTRWYDSEFAARFPIPWHSNLYSTSLSLICAKIYDVIFGYLTEEERLTISAGILNKGVYPALEDWILPETRIHALDSMGHNWWSVCTAEAATAFLALSDYVDPDKKERILEYADNALAEYLRYSGSHMFNKPCNFDKQGLFYESVSYNNFGTGSLLRYLWCRERFSGTNKTIRNAIPENLCDAAMQISVPITKDGKLFFDFLVFGDHSSGGTIDLLIKYAVMTGIASPAAKLCASTYKNDLWDEINEIYKPENQTGLIEYLPLNAVFSSGHAVSRSSWKPDSSVFAVRSGICWNHAHNDAGSFVIYDKGIPYFTDCGTCDYSSPLYHAYYCQAEAHNVLLINDKGSRVEELYRGTKNPASISDSFSHDGIFFVQSDAAGPMSHVCSRMYRNFFWIDNRILVIFDDIYCHDESYAGFSLHFDAKYTEENGKILFDNGKSKARFIPHEPEKITIYEKQGHNDHLENEDVPYIVVNTLKKEKNHLLMSTIEMGYTDYSAEFEEMYGEYSRGIKIDTENKEREIWFNRIADGHIMHDNSNNVIGGYETDAYILLIEKDRDKETENVLIICGSYLRSNGKTYYSSFTKKTDCISII